MRMKIPNAVAISWSKLIAGTGIGMLFICLLWVAFTLFLMDYFVVTDDRRPAEVVEREALQRLSRKIHDNPNTEIQISYTHDGSTAGGIVTHILIYNPVQGSLQDWFKYSQSVALELAGVQADSIHRVAKSGGLLDDLKRQKGVRVIREDPNRYRYLPRPRKKPISHKSTLRTNS
jgi:hypothetical protein